MESEFNETVQTSFLRFRLPRRQVPVVERETTSLITIHVQGVLVD